MGHTQTKPRVNKAKLDSLLARGASAKEISEVLGVSIPTVYYHKRNLLYNRYKKYQTLLAVLDQQGISESDALRRLF